MADQTDQYDLIVLGAGPAGAAAAVHARQLGAAVAVVERHRAGGTCTNTGCVPVRVLAKTARLLRDIRDAHHYGIHVSEPQIVWSETLARVNQVIEHVHHAKHQERSIQDSGAAYINSGATFISPQAIRLEDGRTLTAKSFILACGGHPARLPIPGADLALTSDDLWSLEQPPRSALIVGTGATGVQLATIFQAMGVQLTLIETAPRLSPGDDESVANVLDEAFQQQGIQVIAGVSGLDQIEALPDGLRRVTYHKDNQSHTLTVEAVFFCVGWPANVDGLGLELAGVQLRRRWVQVDDQLRTTAANIYAAGDVTGRMMLVQAANYDAQIAAENAVRGSQLRARHLIVPHGGFTDPEVAGVGLTEAEARQQFPDCLVATSHYRHLERALIDNHPVGLIKLIVDAATRKLLGAHAVGEQAVDIIQAVAVGLAADATIDQLAAMELAYPTYPEIIASAARKLAPEYASVEILPFWKRG